MTMVLFMLFGASAAPTLVPGTSVTVDPPEGFTLSGEFMGFTDGKTSSILVTELAVPAGEMKAQLTPAAIASKGMVELAREQVGSAILLKVEQPAGDLPVHKWMRIDGDDERTALVVATTPKDDPRLDVLKTALLSVQLAPATPAEATLAYGITPAAGFATAGTFQTMQMFTLGGKPPPIPDEEPRFMAGPSVGKADLSDVKTFSKNRLAQLPFEMPRHIELDTLTVSGRTGVELTATVTHPTSRVDRQVYQLILPGSDGTYFIAVGIGGTNNDVATFREMARSLRLDLPAE